MPDPITPDRGHDPARHFAVEVVRRLRDAGHRAFWAGGCVRDLLLGLDPSDYDVATDARPERVMALFRRTVPVGVSFGVVKVLGPRGAGEVEVATFRSDGAYLDGRRPESVVFSSPEEDASRRDFTINGMFYDPITEAIIDHVGGRADLDAGRLRAIGDPHARFAEDKLRLIRAVRFAARFGLVLAPETRSAIVAMAPELPVVAVERIAQELRKMLVHPSRASGMALLREVGLLAVVLPELVPLADLPAELAERPSRTLWDHTLDTLDALPAGPSFALALAALMHESGRATDDGHHATIADRSALLTDRVAARLKASNADRDRARWLSAHHLDLREPAALPVARLKRQLAEPGIDELLDLQRADAEAAEAPADHVEWLERYLRDLPDGPLRPAPLLTGNDLKDRGLPPGPAFRCWLDRAYDAQLENRFGDREGALDWLARALAEPPRRHSL